MIPTPPNEAQLDALRELANVGCGHAANAISRMVGRKKVQIDVPRVLLRPADDVPAMIGGGAARVVAVSLPVHGALRGRVLLVLPTGDALALAGLLLGGDAAAELGAEEKRVIGELAASVGSACVEAIASMTGVSIQAGDPRLSEGAAAEVVEDHFEDGTGRAVVMEARFLAHSTPPVRGQILVLPDPAGVRLLLEKLGL